MSAVFTDLSALALSKEAAEYLAERGWAQHVPTIMEMTRQTFPTAHKIRVAIEDDPEIADLRFVVFEVTVDGLSADEAAAAHQRWCGELFNRLPPPYHYPFVLGLDLGK